MAHGKTNAAEPKPREERTCKVCWPPHPCTVYTITGPDTVECELITKAREKLDDRLVREMKSMRNGPCSRMRVDKEDA